MNLREVTRRLLGKRREAGERYEKLEAGRVDYVYRISWTKLAREWEAARRTQVAEAVRLVMARPDFEKNPIERRFEVPELDDGLAHSGASLLALADVLRALDAHEARDST